MKNKLFPGIGLAVAAALTLSACTTADAAEPEYAPAYEPAVVEVAEEIIEAEPEPEPEPQPEPEEEEEAEEANPLKELLLGYWEQQGVDEPRIMAFFDSNIHGAQSMFGEAQSGQNLDWGWNGRGSTPIRWHLDGDRLFWNNFNNSGEERHMFLEWQMDFADDANELTLTLMTQPFNPDLDVTTVEPFHYRRTELPTEQMQAEANLWEQIQGRWDAPDGRGWVSFGETERGNTGRIAGSLFNENWDSIFNSVQVIDREIWDMTLSWGIFRYFAIVDVTEDTLTLEGLVDGSTETFQRSAE